MVSSRRHRILVRQTLIFKFGSGNTVTVVCWDFASAISVLADSLSSSVTAGSFSPELGPAEDEGERKIVETRFMAMVEGRWGLEGFQGGDWRHRKVFYTGATSAERRCLPILRASTAIWQSATFSPKESQVIEPARTDPNALGWPFSPSVPGFRGRSTADEDLIRLIPIKRMHRLSVAWSNERPRSGVTSPPTPISQRPKRALASDEIKSHKPFATIGYGIVHTLRVTKDNSTHDAPPKSSSTTGKGIHEIQGPHDMRVPQGLLLSDGQRRSRPHRVLDNPPVKPPIGQSPQLFLGHTSFPNHHSGLSQEYGPHVSLGRHVEVLEIESNVDTRAKRLVNTLDTVGRQEQNATVVFQVT